MRARCLPLLAAFLQGMALSSGLGCAHELPGWKLVETKHFRLYTDQKVRTYESLLARLEDVHDGLTSSFFDVAIPPMEVFLFDSTEFHGLLGPIGGMYLRRPRQSPLLVVHGASSAEFLDQSAAQGLAYAFIQATFRAPPLWFNKGLATYIESLMLRDDMAWFGSTRINVGRDALLGRLVPVARLFSPGLNVLQDEGESRFCAASWAVIHYIWHGEDKALRKRFDAFGAALVAVPRVPDSSRRAWEKVYPDVPFAELDDRVHKHLNAAFALPVSSLVGFKLVRAPRPPLQAVPADLGYVNTVRGELRKYRRPDVL